MPVITKKLEEPDGRSPTASHLPQVQTTLTHQLENHHNIEISIGRIHQIMIATHNCILLHITNKQ